MTERIPHYRHFINRLKGLKPYSTKSEFEALIFEAGHLSFPPGSMTEVRSAVESAKKVPELEKHLAHLNKIEALLPK